MIRCESMEDLLPLHATGDTSVEEALQVEEHLGGCEACRAEMAFCSRLVVAARDELAQVPPVPEARPAHPGAHVRRRNVRASSPPGHRRLAAAAVLLAAGLAAGAALGRWSAGEPAPAHGGPEAFVPAGVAAARSLPLSVFSPHARERLSRVARAESPGTR